MIYLKGSCVQDPISNPTKTTLTKAVSFSANKLMGLLVFVISLIASAYAFNLIESAKFYVLYSGVTILRFVPIVVLSIGLFIYLVYRRGLMDSSKLKLTLQSMSLATCCFSFFYAGLFLKDPWISSTMLIDEYNGPVKSIQHYSGLEVQPRKCEKRGLELICGFQAINLLPNDNNFKVNSGSYVIDHKDSRAKFIGFYIGEKRYGKRTYDYFTVPMGQKRSFKVIYELSSDDKMTIAPYVSVVLDSKNHSDKHLNFRAMVVDDYL